MIEREVSLVKGEERVHVVIYSETYQTPPAFGLPASGPMTEYRLKVLLSQEEAAYTRQIKAIGPDASRARIEEAFQQVLRMYQGTGWKAL